MYLDADLHAAYRFANAPINGFPYPHFYIKDVFPNSFYSKIQENLPSFSEMSPISQKRPVKGYNERFVMCFDDDSLNEMERDKADFWKSYRDVFLNGTFGNLLLGKFKNLIDQRFNNRKDISFRDELLLINDITNYSLGPHTDSPRKVISVLFYLPSDNSQKMLGTSIYLPKDTNFLCGGGPHHPHEHFNKIITIPFMPNTAFCFLKTNNSFHGVEKLTIPNTRRWLLLYDIYVDESVLTASATS